MATFLTLLFPLHSYSKNTPVNTRVSEGEKLVCSDFVVLRYNNLLIDINNLFLVTYFVVVLEITFI